MVFAWLNRGFTPVAAPFSPVSPAPAWSPAAPGRLGAAQAEDAGGAAGGISHQRGEL